VNGLKRQGCQYKDFESCTETQREHSRSVNVSSFDTHFYRRNIMSGTTDKIKGLANEAVGNVKQGVGKATGNEKLQVEGKIQEKKGEAQQVVGKVKDAVKKD